ncbi:Molybdopterin or thiamine biosynthesis adenylyltransferase [Sinosporangium album]|uniref:Molybdopterin or thiamine biosynthesis adenylyltransferase n=1 Tax=Sinosporangium album TaxID=504805 RepID=A0A1G8LIV8_9ACTN|nr:ThiF family adenylyltransferase [Sinosporangium album]SDI55624.1 Molybdopterin or thiamine biosynthesis adenylyltransferase [Sinosporangium album]
MRHPRVKPEHRPHRLDDGTIRIGGGVYGLAAEITDPRGWVWAALELMDGRREIEEIVRGLCRKFVDISARQARTVVGALVESGYVENAHRTAPPELTESEILRYERNRAFFRHVDLTPREHGWEAQMRLKSARALVVGLGGTGGHTAWSLVAAGVGAVHCVDDDVVELSNLNRQVLYDEGDVGAPKVEAALRRLRAVNSSVSVTGQRRRVRSQEELAQLVEGFDVLALCADEPRGPDGVRVWASRVCGRRRIPWAGGGYSGPLVTVGVYGPGGACYECLRAGEEARLPAGTPVDLGGPGVSAPSAGLSGQFTAHAVLALLTGVPAVSPGYVTGVNLIDPGHHVYVRHEPRPGCPTCG